MTYESPARKTITYVISKTALQVNPPSLWILM